MDDLDPIALADAALRVQRARHDGAVELDRDAPSAEAARINLRILGRGHLGVSLDETCSEATVLRLLDIFLGVDHGLEIATLDQHVVSKMTREGSNLISRDTPLGDAAVAMATRTSTIQRWRTMNRT